MSDFGICHHIYRYVSLTLFATMLNSCEGESLSENREYTLTMISNEVVYDNTNHAAFTGLLSFQDKLYVAFREGVSHRPATSEDYGNIKIFQNDGTGWKENTTIADKTKDLRDPFLIETRDGKLRAYIGFNTFEEGQYQHSGSVYADFDGSIWSELKSLTHDLPHIVWLWKVRRYKDTYYSVAYLEGEYPALLSSKDGVNWKTVTLFHIEGIFSEADMCFLDDNMHVCIRKDQPIGSPSYWGVARYPFTDFTWTEMTACIESPELIRLPHSRSLYLAGRERIPSSETIDVSLFSVTTDGVLTKISTLISEEGGDRGYPSMAVNDGKLYCCYYTGEDQCKIMMATFEFK